MSRDRSTRWSRNGKPVSELARAARFDAQGRTARGKPWKAIGEVAHELDAATVVLGARGLSRVQSVLLGSVSAAVSAHADRPVFIIHQRPPKEER